MGSLPSPTRLSLATARSLLARAVDKTEALRQTGTFIVVDSSGSPVSVARMDGCAPGALAIVRAKAFGAAANGEPSASFAARMAKFSPAVFASYQAVLRDQPFPGGGAMLVEKEGTALGAMATGLGIGPFVKLAGVEPSELIVDGKPANLEDLIISYALGIDYSPQHGDDMARWVDAYGGPPDPGIKGTGLSPAPRASAQARLGRAQAIADHIVGEAANKGARVAVAIVDAAGDVVTLDRMDGAAPMGVDVAAAVAVASVNFGVASGEIAAQKHYSAALDRLLATVPYPMLALPGGYPLGPQDEPAGGVGIHCHDLDLAQELARGAAQWAATNFEGER